MATKKREPTLADLNAQIAALQAQADALRKKDIAEVVAKVKDAIAHYGLTAADLGFEMPARKAAGRPSSPDADKPAKKARKNAASKRATKGAAKSSTPKGAAKTVKFKDDQGHTWGGMGKRPDWFKAALAAGKTPEELLAKA